MRVRIRRFRTDAGREAVVKNFPQGGRLLNTPMLPVVAALTASSPSGVVGHGVLHKVGTFPFGSALPDIESSGVRVYTGVFQPPARRSVLRPLLTPRRVAPLGSPQVRTRCVPARPPHLPPRLNRSASLCCANSPHRDRPSMRFLFVGPPVSSSLPSPGRLPCRSWLRVVGCSCCHEGPPTGDSHSIYNAPMLGAHKAVEHYAAKRGEVHRQRSGTKKER